MDEEVVAARDAVKAKAERKQRKAVLTKAKYANMFDKDIWSADEIQRREENLYKRTAPRSKAEKDFDYLKKRDEVLENNEILWAKVNTNMANHCALGKTHLLLLRDETENTTGRVLKKGKDTYDDFTGPQIVNVTKKAETFRYISYFLLEKTQQERKEIKEIQDGVENGADVSALMSIYRSKDGPADTTMGIHVKMADIYERVKTFRNLTEATSTIAKWWNEFKKNDYVGVAPDMRGLNKCTNYMETHDLTTRFRLWMTLENDLSVNTAMNWLNKGT